jgi:hypothetical protein
MRKTFSLAGTVTPVSGFNSTFCLEAVSDSRSHALDGAFNSFGRESNGGNGSYFFRSEALTEIEPEDDAFVGSGIEQFIDLTEEDLALDVRGRDEVGQFREMILYVDGEALSAFTGKPGFQGVPGGVGRGSVEILFGRRVFAGEADGAEGRGMADFGANLLDEVVDILGTVETGAVGDVAGNSQEDRMDAIEEFLPHFVVSRRVETLSPDIAKT